MKVFKLGDNVKININPADLSVVNKDMRLIAEANKDRVFTVKECLSSNPYGGRIAYRLDGIEHYYWDGELLEPATPLRVSLVIPSEYVGDYQRDRFKDALNRLGIDAHLTAGSCEREIAEMLIDAFEKSRAEQV